MSASIVRLLGTLLTAVACAALPGMAGAGEEAEEATKGASPEEQQVSEAQTADSPVQMVRQSADAVLALIDKARGYAKENPERFYREVESLLSPVVDFESFARSIMAAHYRNATPEQQQRFAETFKWGLVRTYALALTEFRNGKVVVVPPDRPPRNPQRQTVKMEIHTEHGQVYPVLYSVAQDDSGKWQIRNLIVNGVNMGLTYRNQFNSAMNDPRYGGDIDKVIDSWGELLRTEGGLLEEGGEGAEPQQAEEDQG